LTEGADDAGRDSTAVTTPPPPRRRNGADDVVVPRTAAEVALEAFADRGLVGRSPLSMRLTAASTMPGVQ
jgi:hypothetical protein